MTREIIVTIFNTRSKTTLVTSSKNLLLALNLFRMVFFGASYGCQEGGGSAKRLPFPKLCHTYHTIMKLGTVMPYLKETKKIFESRDTLLKFC